jgi:LPS O-antigen subunit length determinant protein (WzzB/FepE family)
MINQDIKSQDAVLNKPFHQTSSGKSFDDVVDEEIELLEYVTAILSNKYKIAFVSLLVALITFGVSLIMPIKYESASTVAFIQMDSLGGVQPDNRRAPEMVSLLEHDFLSQRVHDNYQERIMAKMRSRIFTEYFITKNNLLPVIFNKHWDEAKKQWKDNFEPNMTLAARIFKKEISWIEHLKENNLLNIRIRLEKPGQTADLANKFVNDFNAYMRDRAIEEADKKLAFLEDNIKKTNIVEMQKSFYRLMEAQLVAKMLAVSKKDFAIEMLDPAIVPIEKASPARKKMTIMAFIATFILSIIFIIARIVLTRINNSIKEYKHQQIATKSDEKAPEIKPFEEDFDDV